MIAISIVLLLLGPTPDPPRLDPLLGAAVELGCAGNRPSRAMAQELLEIESEAGISGQARGILLAAACRESGFNPTKKGDWRPKGCSPKRDEDCRARAVGLVQFWGWAKKGIRRYGSTTDEPREDWRASARYWARHIVAQLPAVDRDCDHSLPYDRWRAAHRTAVVLPLCVKKRRGRCVKRSARCHKPGRKSSHWRILENWKGTPRAVNL